MDKRNKRNVRCNKITMKYPNFFIVGAARSGTTLLYDLLKDIPQIYMSPVKEPSYFAINISQVHKNCGKYYYTKEKYLSLFKEAKDKIVGEASTVYMFDPASPIAIKQSVPDAKIIISIRNPIERAYSEYLFIKQQTGLKLSFEECLNIEMRNLELYNNDFRKFYSIVPVPAITKSKYYTIIKKYIELFGTYNVHILIFEEWISDPLASINRLLNFLGIHSTIKTVIPLPYNSSSNSKVRSLILRASSNNKLCNLYNILPNPMKKTVKKIYKAALLQFGKGNKPELSDSTRKFLSEIFEYDIKQLEILLGRKLPWHE